MEKKRTLIDKILGRNKEVEPEVELPISDPYVLLIENTTDEDKNAVLFGWNKYWNKKNLGSDEGIVITNLLGESDGIDYAYLLAQSATKPFKIGLWRFQSQDKNQLFSTLSLIHSDANGEIYSVPLNLGTLKDAYQFQSDILDSHKSLTVDAGTDIKFIVKANSKIYISIYPISIYDMKSELNEQNKTTPRLTGLNTAPVIIQTQRAENIFVILWSKIKLWFSKLFGQIKLWINAYKLAMKFRKSQRQVDEQAEIDRNIGSKEEPTAQKSPETKPEEPTNN